MTEICCTFHYMNFQVLRDFKRPDNTTEQEVDAAGDGNNLNDSTFIVGNLMGAGSTHRSTQCAGDVLVILDLRPDESLFEAGVAREVC